MRELCFVLGVRGGYDTVGEVGKRVGIYRKQVPFPYRKRASKDIDHCNKIDSQKGISTKGYNRFLTKKKIKNEKGAIFIKRKLLKGIVFFLFIF